MGGEGAERWYDGWLGLESGEGEGGRRERGARVEKRKELVSVIKQDSREEGLTLKRQQRGYP